MDGITSGQIEGLTDGRMDGWMDRQMNGLTEEIKTIYPFGILPIPWV